MIFLGQAFAQSESSLGSHSDSVFQALRKIENQEVRAEALLELSYFWSDYDSLKALKYIEMAEKTLGKKVQQNFYKGVLSYYRGAVYFDIKPDLAKQLYMEAEDHLRSVQSKPKATARYRARNWNSYGALLQRDGDADAFVDILVNKVSTLALEAGDTVLLGNNYQNIALSLMNLQQFEKADQYYQKALDLLHDKPEARSQRLTLRVNSAQNALLSRDYKKAKEILEKASELARQMPNAWDIPLYHSVWGSYWGALKNYQKAAEHFDKGLEAAKILQNDDMRMTILYDKFIAQQNNQQYKAAYKTILELVPYVEEGPILRNKQMVYYNLANTASKLGLYQEAVTWYEAHKLLSDSLYENKGREKILELESRYQMKEKENELLQMKNKNQQQKLSLQRTKNIAGFFLFISIGIGAISLIWYINLKNRKKLTAQSVLLLEEELKNQKQQEKINLYNAILQGEERERSRIARDLHDGLGGMLANVKMKLSTVSNTMDKTANTQESAADLFSITNQLDQSVNELRRVARNLMPESLLYMGLEHALSDLCKGMQQQDCSIDFQASHLSNNYSQSFLIAIYRIVQELLTNAIKHSKASQVWVQCREENKVFFLHVEDNGEGFDPDKIHQNRHGFGLENIQNRIHILNGKLEIDTTLGKGSSFYIQVKINEK